MNYSQNNVFLQEAYYHVPPEHEHFQDILVHSANLCHTHTHETIIYSEGKARDISDFDVGPSVCAFHSIDMVSGFIFGHLYQETHFDNVKRRHRYSQRTSGFCERLRGGSVLLFKRKKWPFGSFERW